MFVWWVVDAEVDAVEEGEKVERGLSSVGRSGEEGMEALLWLRLLSWF
jgi:hypothetical protein